jgi:hypothetical protein
MTVSTVWFFSQPLTSPSCLTPIVVNKKIQAATIIIRGTRISTVGFRRRSAFNEVVAIAGSCSNNPLMAALRRRIANSTGQMTLTRITSSTLCLTGCASV